MDANKLAEAWRTQHGYTGRGGVVIICDGVVNSWVNELRNPDHWVPGCIAVDESGNQWISVGGTSQRGSELWKPISAVKSE